MESRPLTLVLIAVAILAALYVRRLRVPMTGTKPSDWMWIPLGVAGPGVEQSRERVLRKELLSIDQMVKEGEARGIRIDLGSPMTREQFERFLDPQVSR